MVTRSLFIDQYVQKLGDALKVPEDQARILLGYQAVVLLNWPLNFINNPTARLLYSFLIGLSLQYFCFRDQIFHVLILALTTSVLMKIFKRDSQQRYILFFCFSYLSFANVKRMLDEQATWKADIIRHVYYIVQRLTAMSLLYKDGGINESAQSAIEANLTSYQFKHRIKEKPTLMEILSYSFSSCGCIFGPFFEFDDYRAFIRLEGTYKNIPLTILPSLRKHANFFLYVGLYVILNKHFSDNEMIKEWYLNSSLIYRIYYAFMVLQTRAFMYYSAFAHQETGCIASGLSYQKRKIKDENGKEQLIDCWEKIECGKAWKMELTCNTGTIIQYWNHSFVTYIKNHVFLRLVEPGKKKGSFIHKFAALVISAFIHGFYPIYYVTFISMALANEIANDCTSLQESLFDKYLPRFVQFIIAFAWSRLMFGTLLTPYFAIDNMKALIIMKSFYFLPYILIIVVLLIVKLPWIRRYRKQKTL